MHQGNTAHMATCTTCFRPFWDKVPLTTAFIQTHRVGRRTHGLRPVLAERGRREARGRPQERGRLRQAAHGCDRPPARDQRVRARPRYCRRCKRRYRRQQAHLRRDTTEVRNLISCCCSGSPHVRQECKLTQPRLQMTVPSNPGRMICKGNKEPPSRNSCLPASGTQPCNSKGVLHINFCKHAPGNFSSAAPHNHPYAILSV